MRFGSKSGPAASGPGAIAVRDVDVTRAPAYGPPKRAGDGPGRAKPSHPQVDRGIMSG
ncbi:hypothetical protein [Pendulispora albinea]|uniref:Uncharacterized protein n=1 Tax=Pendulispora albinea TaxID=2741071 RepID=A0ABZ2M6A8_9BACT